MNKVILIGRLCADPEIRTTQGGTPVATYRLAVDRRRKKDGQQEADFITCIAWDKGAEFASKWLNKGMKIAITGRLQTRTWEAQDGTKRYATEVVVEEHEFCGGRSDLGQPQEAGQHQEEGPSDFEEVQDDDLPF